MNNNIDIDLQKFECHVILEQLSQKASDIFKKITDDRYYDRKNFSNYARQLLEFLTDEVLSAHGCDIYKYKDLNSKLKSPELSNIASRKLLVLMDNIKTIGNEGSHFDGNPTDIECNIALLSLINVIKWTKIKLNIVCNNQNFQAIFLRKSLKDCELLTRISTN